MSDDAPYVVTRALLVALKGRETQILDGLGIAWRSGHPHIRCPYRDHADSDPSWRWDDKRAKAVCTCTTGDAIIDVVMKTKGLEFDAAKLHAAELLGETELIRQPGSKASKTDASTLLAPPKGRRDDELVRNYLAARLGVLPAAAPMPSTPIAGWTGLAYHDKEDPADPWPKKIGEFPCAVFGMVGPDGKKHAHRIYLAPGGSGKAVLPQRADGTIRDVKKSARLAEGDKVGGRCVIWGDAATAVTLVLAEGTETAAALAFLYAKQVAGGRVAVAAAISAPGLEQVRLWPATKRVLIAADRDEAPKDDGRPGSRRGEQAARKLIARLAAEHDDIEVAILLPGMPGESVDWLDILRRDGAGALHRAFAHPPFLEPAQLAELRRDARKRAEKGVSADGASAAADGAAGKGTGDKEEKAGRRRPHPLSYIDELDVELWHDESSVAYATMPLKGSYANMAIGDPLFAKWLTGVAYRRTGSAPSREKIEEAKRVLDARATFDGECYKTFRRVGGLDGVTYIDLGCPRWRSIRADRDGWSVVDRVPIKFVRSDAMRPLPEPEPSEDGIERELRQHVDFRDDRDIKLTASFLVAAWHPTGPYPIVYAGGEQGAAKTWFCELAHLVIDPHQAETRSLPQDEEGLVVAARNSWCQVFDNVSHIPGWLSDALCRVATGSGFVKRKFYTDQDETVFSFERPIIMNGIEPLRGRPDLQDRSIFITLDRIAENRRRPKQEVRARFLEARPRIMGAVLDGVVASLRNRPTLKLDKLPRMADFACIAAAAAPGLGWTTDDFLAAYAESRAEGVDNSFESSPLATAIHALVADKSIRYPWRGTMRQLLEAVKLLVPVEDARAKDFPRNPGDLGGKITRLGEVLRSMGVEFRREKKKDRTRERIIYLWRTDAADAPPEDGTTDPSPPPHPDLIED